jgi:hypothetical protein
MLTTMTTTARPRHLWPVDHLSVDQAQAALRSFLSTLGHCSDDFALEVDPESQLSALLGLPDRLVTVRRVSTGHERLYAVGAASSWLAELLQDLEDGQFGPSGD